MKRGAFLEIPLIIFIFIFLVVLFILYFAYFKSTSTFRDGDILEGVDSRFSDTLILSYLTHTVTFEKDGLKEMNMIDLSALYHDALYRHDNEDVSFYRKKLEEETNLFFKTHTVNTIWTVYYDKIDLPDSDGHRKWKFTSAAVLGSISLDPTRESTFRKTGRTCVLIPIPSRTEPINMEFLFSREGKDSARARQEYDELRSEGGFSC